jgi:hypothetical protein
MLSCCATDVTLRNISKKENCMSIGSIAPDRNMAQAYRQILLAVPDKIRVVEALLSEAIPLAKRLEGQGRRSLSRAAEPSCF